MGVKKDFLKSAFLEEVIETGHLLSLRGWAERNAGNISCLMSSAEAEKYFNLNQPKESFPLNINLKDLAGKIFLVKGTGMFFRNLKKDPARGLGVVKVAENGEHFDLLWGFENGGGPTSELPMHFMGHQARFKADPGHAVIIHTHTTNVIIMSTRPELDEKTFTAALWRIHSECLVVFPEGVGLLPWMVPGTEEIGLATANKLMDFRLVIWPLHGIIGAGRSIDEAMGLIETAEKAAEIYLKSIILPLRVNASVSHKASYPVGDPEGMDAPRTITDEQLRDLAKRFNLNPRKGIIDEV